jgi:hypothetical protein
MACAESSYVAIRVVASDGADAWWSAARRSAHVPPALKALFNGRARIEMTAEEADAALSWAATLDGWAAAKPKPLVAYPSVPDE